MWKGYTDYIVTSQLGEFLTKITEENFKTVKNNGIDYYNIPASFDIETSSFYENGEKRGIMYIWQLGINGSVLYGRTWKELNEAIEKISIALNISLTKRIIIYVHNLAYEFQFIARRFNWHNVFSPKKRRPLYAVTTKGIEFKCSYFLSNASLAHVGKEMLMKYKCEKLEGGLNYKLIRNQLTPLTEKEIDYCIEDVRVVMCFIQEKIENDGNILEIPLTNTGYVRKYCRKNVFSDKDKMNYKALIKSMKIKDKDEYDQLQRAFMGGFTHTSCIHHCSDTKLWIEDVGSADLTSSYPYAMVGQYYPMTSSFLIENIENEKQLIHYLQNYCCLFDIEFINLEPATTFEHIISESKCKIEGRKLTNNGRIVRADRVKTTITELDYEWICKFYKWDKCKITNFRIYERGYLPKSLILSILDLYEMKTSLKGIKDKEVDYMISKNMINAVYGMTVTNIIRDEEIFENNEWATIECDKESQLLNYNKNTKRFLFYPWGIWVTAHARSNLYSAIWEFGEDYVYADTDSIKGVNFDKHTKYFEDYNRNVKLSLLEVCGEYNIPFSKVSPKTKNGIEKMLGVWEIEEGYKYFKSTGAKRYLYVTTDGVLNLTVSGLNKRYAIPYLIATTNNIDLLSEEYEKIKKAYAGDKELMQWVISQNYKYGLIFKNFGDGMYIPAGHTGKQTLTYSDKCISGTVKDYTGKYAPYFELSFSHMEEQDYRMGISNEYLNFLMGIESFENAL